MKRPLPVKKEFPAGWQPAAHKKKARGKGTADLWLPVECGSLSCSQAAGGDVFSAWFGKIQLDKTLCLLQDNLEHHLGIPGDGFVYDLLTRDRRPVGHGIMF